MRQEILKWTLNILQLLAVYLILYAIFYYSLGHVKSNNSIGALMSLFVSFLFWNKYKAFSNKLINFNSNKSSLENYSENTEHKKALDGIISFLLNSFFFGYLNVRWKRLVRTSILFIFSILTLWMKVTHKGEPIALLLLFIFVVLASYVIQPFVDRKS